MNECKDCQVCKFKEICPTQTKKQEDHDYEPYHPRSVTGTELFWREVRATVGGTPTPLPEMNPWGEDED